MLEDKEQEKHEYNCFLHKLSTIDEIQPKNKLDTTK